MQRKPDMTPFYRRILTDAWRIAWNHKHLWVFGFFATLIGFGAVTEVFFNSYERTADALPLAASAGSLSALIPGLTTIRAIVAYSPYPALSLLIFLVVFTMLFAVFAWMTLVSVGALILGARKISRGGEPTFGDGVKAGAEKFWSLLGVNLVSKFVIMLALVMTGANLYILMKDRTLLSGFFYIGSFIIFTAISFVASLGAVYGSIGVAVKDEKTEKAVNGALALISEHWLVSLEMAVLLLVASLATGVAVALGTLVLSVPLIFLIVVAAVFKAQAAVYAVMTLTAVMLLIMVVCLGAFLTTFQTSAWTLLWSELVERKPSSKLLRLMHRWQSH
ncbi:MAG TPA: hypothetical protein VL500_03015 [Candidatus Eisenbacteria bacterium]|jgi:hypothetical protein|nr:hypothetical protein [Candidatus Eisenbacteria bacterium]